MLDIQSMRKAEVKPFELWSDEEKASRFVAVAKATKWFFQKRGFTCIVRRNQLASSVKVNETTL